MHWTTDFVWPIYILAADDSIWHEAHSHCKLIEGLGSNKWGSFTTSMQAPDGASVSSDNVASNQHDAVPAVPSCKSSFEVDTPGAFWVICHRRLFQACQPAVISWYILQLIVSSSHHPLLLEPPALSQQATASDVEPDLFMLHLVVHR